jgi:hypothetical protein
MGVSQGTKKQKQDVNEAVQHKVLEAVGEVAVLKEARSKRVESETRFAFQIVGGGRGVWPT